MSVTYETSFTMRGATGVIHQRHQVLCLPRKMTRIINPRDTWNVIYNARNNRHHPSTSPNAVPATKNDSHHWSSWHMKRHLQCAEQQASPSNLTKYCACHAKWFSWLMSVTHDTSFTMRGATDLILQHHQMLRLPRKMTRIIYPRDIPVRRAYFSPLGNAFCIENYNISRSGYLPRFHRILRLPQKVTLQDHQILRLARKVTLQDHQLPRKMTRIIYPRDIWNVIYNARSNKHHPPTSPNAAPATKNDAHHWLSSHMKRHLQCAEQQASPSNLTKYCACHAKLHSKIKEKFAENSWSVISNARPIRAWSEHDPNMIRPWNCKTEPVRSQSLLFPPRQRILYWKLQHFALRLSTQISPNTAPATKSDAPRLPNTAPATKSDTPRSPNTAPATKSSTPRSPNAAPAMKSDTELLLDCTLTCYLIWIVALLTCYLTALSELLLYWAATWLNCYVTELLLYWTVTLLSCYFTELFLDWAVSLVGCCCTELLLYWAATWLNCYLTELLLYWTVTLLSCYFTELLLYWAVSLLSCYFTELLLYWAVTWLSSYFTAVTLLSCYFAELFLYWAVSLVSCYLTELLLYWAVTLLSCSLTELFL